MPDPLSIRVTVECRPDTSRARAEQIARSIQRYAEQRPGVSHAYERDVYSLEDFDVDENPGRCATCGGHEGAEGGGGGAEPCECDAAPPPPAGPPPVCPECERPTEWVTGTELRDRLPAHERWSSSEDWNGWRCANAECEFYGTEPWEPR